MAQVAAPDLAEWVFLLRALALVDRAFAERAAGLRVGALTLHEQQFVKIAQEGRDIILGLLILGTIVAYVRRDLPRS